MKDFAVSFKGGMARGLSGIGLMRFLQEEGLKPKYYAGSSSGALIASGFAMNFTWDKILNDFKKVKVNKLISIKSLITKGGIISKEKFLGVLNDTLGSPIERLDIKNLPNKLYIFASSLKSRQRIIIHSGSLGEALVKSCSYPLVLARDPDHSDIIDGDFTSSYSARYLRDKGAEIVIGCRYKPKRVSVFTTNPIDTLISTYRLVLEEIDGFYDKMDPVDYELEVLANDVGYMRFDKIDTIVDRAYKKVKLHKKQILELLE